MAKDKGKNKPGKGGGKKELTPEQKNEQALANMYTVEGANAGNALINKFLQPGTLGRVSTDIEGAQGSLDRYRGLYDKTTSRSADQNQVVSMMNAGLQGYTSPEYQAQREQMQRGLQSNYATSAGQLARAQSRGKVYGAAGVAQLANLQRSTQNSKDQLDQDLMIKNIDEKQRRLMEFGDYTRGLEQEEFDRRAQATKGIADEEAALRNEQLERQKVNLGQANAETSAQIGAFTGAGALALAQRNQKKAQQIQQKALKQVARI